MADNIKTWKLAGDALRATDEKQCDHDWQLAGATTATDGWKCRKCGAKVETHADAGPPRTTDEKGEG